MAATPSPTRADWVDSRLRAGILSGDLAPGARLVVTELADRYGVSPTPLREALRRLAAEGLVEWLPQRGARVASATRRDAEDLYELRLALEPVALGQSIASAGADPDYVVAVRASYAAFSEAGSDLGEVLSAHHAFHASLMARCPNRPMLTAIDRYAQQSLRFQMLATAGRAGLRDLDAEHRALLAAAVEGRAEDGARMLTEHLGASLAELRARPA
ncbi:MAG: GntR family transcriptional regulator [Actinomycetes bacterium]